MASQGLSPAELTFQSFRHSQGNGALQIQILNYIEDQTGMSPSFEQDQPTLERYYSFLGGNAARRHAEFVDPSDMESRVSNVLTIMGQDFSAAKRTVPPMINTIKELTAAVTSTEQGRFTFTSIEGLQGQALARAAHRLNTGQHSFLEYYGAQGRNTGFTAFNDMYADMWKYFQSPDFTLQAGIHQETAKLAEQQIRDLMTAEAQMVR